MSSGVNVIGLLISSIGELVKAIDELKLAKMKRDSLMIDGKIQKVDIAVEGVNGRGIGFQKQKDGTYKVLAETGGLTTEEAKKQLKLVNEIRKKYAYNTVINELRRQGYQVAEEKAEGKQVRILARKWVA